MTVLVEYRWQPHGDREPQRIVFDGPYLTITERGGTQVVVTPDGETIMPTAEMGKEYSILGEVRFE